MLPLQYLLMGPESNQSCEWVSRSQTWTELHPTPVSLLQQQKQQSKFTQREILCWLSNVSGWDKLWRLVWTSFLGKLWWRGAVTGVAPLVSIQLYRSQRMEVEGGQKTEGWERMWGGGRACRRTWKRKMKTGRDDNNRRQREELEHEERADRVERKREKERIWEEDRKRQGKKGKG